MNGRVIGFSGLSFEPTVIDGEVVGWIDVSDSTLGAIATMDDDLGDPERVRLIYPSAEVRIRRAGDFVLVLRTAEDRSFDDVWIWSGVEHDTAVRALESLRLGRHLRPAIRFARLPSLSDDEAWAAYRHTAPIEVPAARGPAFDPTQVLSPSGYDGIRTAWDDAVGPRLSTAALVPIRDDDERITVFVDREGQPEWTILARRATTRREPAHWSLVLGSRWLIVGGR
jgi:hypothetical protein